MGKKNLIWLGKEKEVGGLSSREPWGPGAQVGAPGLPERGVERAEARSACSVLEEASPSEPGPEGAMAVLSGSPATRPRSSGARETAARRRRGSSRPPSLPRPSCGGPAQTNETSGG